MVLEGVVLRKELQTVGGAEAVLEAHGLLHVPPLQVGAAVQDFAVVRHLQGGDVRLEDQLGNVRGRRAALLQLVLDMLHLAGAPVVLPDGLHARQLPADKAQDARVVDRHRPVVPGVQVYGIAEREAEVRIVQVLHQLRGRLDALGPVQDQQAPEAVRQEKVHIQRLIQPVLLPADHHHGKGAAVQPRPADRVGDLLLDGVLRLQAGKIVKGFLRQGGVQAVPGPGHVLRGHVDDPHRQPGLPVHGRQPLRIRGQARAQEGAGGEQGRVLAQEGRGVGVAVRGAPAFLHASCPPALRNRVVRVWQR